MPETYSQPPASELEKLRDILYGDQSRATQHRISELETSIVNLRQELSTLIDKNFKQLAAQLEKYAEQTGRQISIHTKQFNDHAGQLASHAGKLDEHAAWLAEQAGQLETTRQELNDQDQRIEAALTNQITTLRDEMHHQVATLSDQLQNEVQKLNEEGEQHVSTLSQQFQAAQQELSKRMVGGFTEHRQTLEQHSQTAEGHRQTLEQHHQTLLTLKTEMGKQDGLLHSQVLDIQAALETSKVSRQELSQALIELSQRLHLS